MIKINYGNSYLQTPEPNITHAKYWSLKKLRSNKWIVYEIRSGQMFQVFPNKLRAYYAASKLNGMVKDYFFFGDLLINM